MARLRLNFRYRKKVKIERQFATRGSFVKCMKKLIVLPLVGIVALLSSCIVDRHGRVWPAPVGVGIPGPVVVGPGYYGGGWGIYGEPFFIFNGLNYYNWHGRYCYYDHGHRVFVSHLPAGGHYYRRRY